MTKPKFTSVTPQQISAVMKHMRSRVDPKNCVRTREQCQKAAFMSAVARWEKKQAT